MPGPCCARCAAPVDPLRSSAIIDGGRVLSVCSRCATHGAPRAVEPAVLVAHEPWRRCRCGQPIAPGTARTVIAGAAVELRCGHCDWDRPAMIPAPVPVPLAMPPRPTPRRRSIAYVAAAILGLGAVTAFASNRLATPTSATLALSPTETVQPPSQAAPTDSPNVAPVPAAEPVAVPTDAPSAEDLDASEDDDIEIGQDADRDDTEDVSDSVDHESLRDWTHPLPGTNEAVPTSPSRRFGAERPGSRPGECGAGHCGVDLGGEIGAPVVSVKAGVVVRVEERANRRSGRYVRVRHSGGIVTWYMHLDEVAPGLAEGTPVKAGQRLGTLGKSGIQSSLPHLHFSVQSPTEAGTMRYVDPADALAGAAVLDPLDVIESLGDLSL